MACAMLLSAGPLVEPANAQDGACKSEVITATGPPKIAIRRQRQLDGGGSAMREAVAAWTREAEARFGDEYKNWDRAKDSKFNCSPSGTASVQCTISGRPCTASSERRDPQRVERVRGDDDTRRSERRRDRASDRRGSVRSSRRDRDRYYDDDDDGEIQNYGYVRGQYLEDEDDYRYRGRRHRQHWRHGYWNGGRNRCAEVQYMLQACGYHVYRDGVCGPETADAVASFQSRNGLYPSGHANAYTTEVLIRRCIR